VLFVQAANYTPVKSRKIDLIVLHSMEAPQKGSTAESVAGYFRRSGTRVSAHHCFDQDSQVRCLEDHDVAWAAPGSNHNGLHYEHAGYARQDRSDWVLPSSLSMLVLSAQQAAKDVTAYKIPIEFCDYSDLRAGKRGITTHYEVSRAFKRSDHTDPGPGFAIDIYLDLVRKALEIIKPVVPRKEPNMAYKKFSCPTGGYWLLKLDDGGVGSFDGAPFFGSLSGLAKIVAPLVDLCPFVVDGQVKGYWIVDEEGHLYAFGEAPHYGSYADHPDWHSAERKILGITQLTGQTINEPITYKFVAREARDDDYVIDPYVFPVATQ
jgi:hypothetical protein